MTPDIKIEGLTPLLQVFDMPASLKFYRNILGFKVIMSSEDSDEANWVLLKLNDIELMLNTAYEREYRPKMPDANRIAVHNDTCLYFGCPNTDALYEHLKSNGLELNKPEITPYNWKAIHLKDPDGYCLCFHWPLPNN
jgi:uncharacterized glyoxalase superfamily protein PhnB